jgi:hypothetical protein
MSLFVCFECDSLSEELEKEECQVAKKLYEARKRSLAELGLVYSH